MYEVTIFFSDRLLYELTYDQLLAITFPNPVTEVLKLIGYTTVEDITIMAERLPVETSSLVVTFVTPDVVKPELFGHAMSYKVRRVVDEVT